MLWTEIKITIFIFLKEKIAETERPGTNAMMATLRYKVHY